MPLNMDNDQGTFSSTLVRRNLTLHECETWKFLRRLNVILTDNTHGTEKIIGIFFTSMFNRRSPINQSTSSRYFSGHKRQSCQQMLEVTQVSLNHSKLFICYFNNLGHAIDTRRCMIGHDQDYE